MPASTRAPRSGAGVRGADRLLWHAETSTETWRLFLQCVYAAAYPARRTALYTSAHPPIPSHLLCPTIATYPNLRPTPFASNWQTRCLLPQLGLMQQLC